MTASTVSVKVEQWLRGEHSYQFKKFDDIYGDELVRRRNYIWDDEVPNKWHRSVVHRRGRSLLLANQQLLKVCAASRAVVVYDACIGGESRHTASARTFADIHEHFAGLDLDELQDEPDLYNTDFESVFGDRGPHGRTLRAGELAVAGLLEQSRVEGVIQLPKPGIPSGPAL